MVPTGALVGVDTGEVPGKQSEGVRATSERSAPERERDKPEHCGDQDEPGQRDQNAERASEPYA